MNIYGWKENEQASLGLFRCTYKGTLGDTARRAGRVTSIMSLGGTAVAFLHSSVIKPRTAHSQCVKFAHVIYRIGCDILLVTTCSGLLGSSSDHFHARKLESAYDRAPNDGGNRRGMTVQRISYLLILGVVRMHNPYVVSGSLRRLLCPDHFKWKVRQDTIRTSPNKTREHRKITT
jgi:hypothetical protein